MDSRGVTTVLFADYSLVLLCMRETIPVGHDVVKPVC